MGSRIDQGPGATPAPPARGAGECAAAVGAAPAVACPPEAEGPAASGWRASLQLGFERRGARTVLVERSARGPLVVQRPFYPERGRCHLYLLHPPGGVVGGDQLVVRAHLAPASEAVVTTPGAGKYYRSAGPLSTVDQRWQLAGSACLELLPQESIYFPGARVRLHTRVELAAGARLALWDIHCFGRPAIAERFDTGSVDCRLELSRGGRALFNERLRADAGRLDQAAGLAGRPVLGTLLLSPADEAMLASLREALAAARRSLPRRQAADEWLAATLVDELLVVRYLGHCSERARALLASAWAAAREGLFGCPPCPPRIWNT